MLRMKITMKFFAAAAIFVLPALSQPYMETFPHEVSGQALGSFVKKTTDEGIENKATHSGGALGSYRFYFSSRQGVEATYGYAQNTQSYGLNSAGLESRPARTRPRGPFSSGFHLAGSRRSLWLEPARSFSIRRTTPPPKGKHALPSYMAAAWISIFRSPSLLRAQYRGLATIHRPTICRRSRMSSDNASGAALSRDRLSLLKNTSPTTRRSGRKRSFLLVAESSTCP